VRRPLPHPRTAGRVARPARADLGPPIRRGPVRSPGRRRRPRPHRLEVRPGPGADRPRLRSHRPERVPLPTGHGPGRTATPGHPLDRCRELGLIRPRGRQRTDSTHVLAAVRTLNRLERVGETMRAALNDVAVLAPDWLQALAPAEWYRRYGGRVEN